MTRLVPRLAGDRRFLDLASHLKLDRLQADQLQAHIQGRWQSGPLNRTDWPKPVVLAYGPASQHLVSPQSTNVEERNFSWIDDRQALGHKLRRVLTRHGFLPIAPLTRAREAIVDSLARLRKSQPRGNLKFRHILQSAIRRALWLPRWLHALAALATILLVLAISTLAAAALFVIAAVIVFLVAFVGIVAPPLAEIFSRPRLRMVRRSS